jgi:eukaryotic-like serine/threonine-protein kinase
MPTSLQARWTALGVHDAGALDLSETITPHTFAQARREPAPRIDAPPVSGRVESVASITFSELPHISLSGPVSARDPSAAPVRSADLDVTGVLGEGGMGRVLLARQRSLQRDVAVKIVRPRREDAGALRRLLVEAVITGSLEHPGIVPVHALGCDDAGRPVLVMKRIEGVSWRELCRDPDNPGWARLDGGSDDRLVAHLEILMQVSNALQFAHERGIVHRDVKPSNVMIGSCGEVYLVDWGIAMRLGEPEEPLGVVDVELVGTPAYMASEMVWGEPHLIDARTDVYLLGATLHNVLTGAPRHQGDTLFEMMSAARDSLPHAYGPEVPAELAAICNRATSRDPAERYPSAIAFRRAISDYLRHRGSVALGDAAAAQLAELRAVIAEREGASAPRRIHQLMSECRFGFTQALRAWKDNAAAREGLGACLGLMIEHELSLGNRDAAAALLAELPEPRPDLAGRLAALDAAIAEKQERDARLRTLEQEHDLSVGARPRLVMIAIIGVGTVVVSAIAWQAPRTPPLRTLVIYILTLDAIVGAGVLLKRKLLMTSHMGRLATGGLTVSGLGILAHRLLCMRFGTPVDEVLIGDMGLLSCVLAFSALMLPGWLRGGLALAAVSAAGIVVTLARPELAVPSASWTAILIFGTLSYVCYRQIKQR